jgi:hypothetical protein
MFVDEMPTKKIPLDNDKWVEIQYLSRGFKDELTAFLASVRKKLNKSDNEAEKQTNQEYDQGEVYSKLKELEYKKMVAGIRKWSSDKPIDLESVKLFRGDVFDKVIKEIDQFNELSEEEVKN